MSRRYRSNNSWRKAPTTPACSCCERPSWGSRILSCPCLRRMARRFGQLRKEPENLPASSAPGWSCIRRRMCSWPKGVRSISSRKRVWSPAMPRCVKAWSLPPARLPLSSCSIASRSPVSRSRSCSRSRKRPSMCLPRLIPRMGPPFAQPGCSRRSRSWASALRWIAAAFAASLWPAKWGARSIEP